MKPALIALMAALTWSASALSAQTGSVDDSVSARSADAARSSVVCRCAERSLGAYWDGADEVLFGRLLGVEDGSANRTFRMEVAERPWKLWRAREEPVGVADTVGYVTASSSAACGVQPVAGAVYAIFAVADPGGGQLPRVDSCSGTRIFRNEVGAAPQGFEDVPGRFVHGRLDALSGLEELDRVVAVYPDETSIENSVLVGLLDLEALAHGGNVPIRDRPDPAAPVTASVSSYGDIESREVGYEVGAATVFARAEGWSRVRLADGAYGWVAPEDAGTWFPYRALPVRRLAYLTEAWSGHLWPDPGAGIPSRPSETEPAGREIAAEVFESTVVGGTVWFRVGVLSGSPCGGGEVRVVRSGWTLAYGSDGRPSVWYYSRGC